jgi:hypothetical protein
VKKITILTEFLEIPAITHGKIGLLIECAPDNEIIKKYPDAVNVSTLIDDPENIRRLACNVTTKILADEPYFRGIPQLTILHETVSAQLYKIFQLIHLHDYILNEGYETCEFVIPSWWSEELKKLTVLIDSPLRVMTPVSSSQSGLRRCINRITSSHFSINTIYTELKQALDQIDPFHRRAMWSIKYKKCEYEKHKIWFYTTAVNYTNIGLLYEPHFSKSFYFLVENNLTGGKPLIERQRSFSSIYAFSRPEFIPNRDEISETAHAIHIHVSNVSLNTDESIARQVFLRSSWWKLFVSRLLPYGLFSSHLFEHWINEAEPSGLIVGNQVYEGYALLNAQRKKIPTILLQHGVLADYFPYSDHPVDYYIVRGEFFYERLSPISQKRAIIFNPSGNVMQKNVTPRKKKSIVFMTMPLFLLPITADIESILLALIKAMAGTETELMIRVHPLERISDYKNRIKKLLKRTSSKLNVRYNQSGNLDELLEEAVATVTFGSTVFLDCIKNDVPIISFDWHNFGFKEKIKSHHVFNFAKSLDDFIRIITQAVHGELSGRKHNLNHFLSNNSIEEFKLTINNLFCN